MLENIKKRSNFVKNNQGSNSFIENKAGLLDFWRNIKQSERTLLIYNFVGPISELFITFSIITIIVAGFIALLQSHAKIAKGRVSALILDELSNHFLPKFPYILFSLILFFFISVVFRNYTVNYLGEKYGYSLRKTYFEALITKNIGWYETNDTGNLPRRFINEIKNMQRVMGGGLFFCMKTFYTVIFCVFISFMFNKKICVIMVSLCIVITVFYKSLDFLKVKKENFSFSIAKEIIDNIKVIFTFDGIKKEKERYRISINEAKKTNNTNSFIDGIGSAVLMFFIPLCFSVLLLITLKYGYISRSLHAVVLIFNSVAFLFPIIAFLVLKSGLSDISAIEASRISGAAVFNAIQNKSEINPLQDGYIRKRNKGSLDIKNVSFSYPYRNENVLMDINLSIPGGSTVAFVGPSGSGKSTIIKLLQRFYDPSNGSISVEGVNLKELNLAYYRKQIGYVGQEPILFEGTIYENIAQGINAKGKLCLDEIVEVCKLANAHDFIMDLPQKYNTFVGEGGCLLSIGQKQRICIARAIINDPPIILLDEATSALDTTSERVVQDALNKSSVNKTTIVIAHRLSTIKHADIIITMKEGRIVESGKHEDLINSRGLYYELVKAQEIKPYIKPSKKETLIPKNKKMLDFEDDSKEDAYLSNKNNIMQYMLKYKILLIISSILCIINGAVLPFFAYKVSQIFSFFYNIFIYKELYISNYLITLSVELICIGLFGASGQIGKITLFKILENNVRRDLQYDKLSNIVNSNIEFFDKDENSPGILCTKLELDTQKASSLYIGPLIFSLNLIGGLVSCLYLCFNLSPFITIILIVILASCIFIRMFINSKLSEKLTRVKNSYEKITQVSLEVFGNIQTVASFALEDVFISKFKKINKYSHEAVEAFNKNNKWIGAFIEIIIFLYIGAAMILCIYLINADHILYSVPIIVLCMSAFAIDNLANLEYIWNYHSSLLSSKSYFEKPENRKIKDGNKYKLIKGDIDVEDVCFSYSTRKDNPILRGLTLSLDAYNNIGVVGPSGCGKSTLMSLLLSFYEADSGQILFDGIDIKDWSLSKLRKQMALVEQEPKLFNTSIIENIKYGKPDATMDEVINAAKISNAHDFITELSEGYNTKVGEKGGSLSGGQKQRIAIARAIIRNPSILILDEATSALDSFSEQLVQQAIENASSGRTCLSIAHRLASIQNCDIIIVINEGRLFEIGNHNELMVKEGLYYKLATQQNLE